MAATTRGIAYPTSGDSIAPLETHFASLANTADSALDNLKTEIGISPISGVYSFVGPAAASTYVDVSITFPESFAAAPDVVLTVQGGATMSPYVANILGNISISGFTARIYRIAGSTAETDLLLNWMAK
jgi:hypothetical protein